MATLTLITADVRSQINEPSSSNSNYTDAELTVFINQAIRFTASQILYPRTSGTVSPVASQKTYSLPTDFQHLLIAYYGDVSISGSIVKLKPVTHERLSEISESWLEDVAGNTGKPEYFMLLSRTQFVLFPAPDTANSVSGNLTRIYYSNVPTDLSSGSESPNLPTAFHDVIATYVAHLCYGGKLQNPKLSISKLNEFNLKMASIKLPTTQEAFQWAFEFGDSDSIN